MADILISKFTTQIPRVGATPATPGFAESEGQDPVAPSGTPQVYTPVTIGSPSNGLSISGTQVLTIGLASTSDTGALSSTDWNTFNNKLNLTSPITGYTVGANTALAATDTILQAFGKVQGQINQRVSGVGVADRVSLWSGSNTINSESNLTFNRSTTRLTTNNVISGATGYHGTLGGNLEFILIATSTETRLASYNNKPLFIRTNDINRAIILGTGEFGINTAAPTNTLDVNGTARIRTINNLGVSATNVLVPDATGVVSLRTASQFLADAGGISGTIASGQVAFGTGVNTVGGDSGLTWDNTFKSLNIIGSDINSHVSVTGLAPNFRLIDSDGASAFLVSNANFFFISLTNISTSTSLLRLTSTGLAVGLNFSPTNTLDVNGTARIRTINNLGSAATSVLVPSATGVVSLRTLAELSADMGVLTESTQVISTSGTINDLTTTATTLVFTGATVTLTGIAAITNGFERTIVNLTGSTLTIPYFSASSLAANRFLFSLKIPNRGVVKVKYSTNASNVWLLASGVFNPNLDTIGSYTNEFIGIGRVSANNIGLSVRSVANADSAFSLACERLDGTRTFEVRSVSMYSYVESFWQGTSGFANQWVRATGASSWATIWQSNTGTDVASVNASGGFNGLGDSSFGVSHITPVSNTRLAVRGKGTTTQNTLLLEDSAGTDNAEFLDNGQIRFLRLPTSSAGLAAGDLWNDNGNVRIGTTVTFRDQESVKTTASADQTLPSGTLTILDYDSTLLNNSTATYTVATDGRITINTTGVYTITAGVVIEADAVTALESAFLGIFRNGDLVAISSINTTIAAGAQSGLSTSTILSLTATDIIDCRALVNSVGGVANGLARRLGTLLGANATQVNSLSITKNSM